MTQACTAMPASSYRWRRLGTSIAWHLGKLGVRDVVLLERDRLTSGHMARGGADSHRAACRPRLDWIEALHPPPYSTPCPRTGLSPAFASAAMSIWLRPVRRQVLRRDANFVRVHGVSGSNSQPSEIADMFR